MQYLANLGKLVLAKNNGTVHLEVIILKSQFTK